MPNHEISAALLSNDDQTASDAPGAWAGVTTGGASAIDDFARTHVASSRKLIPQGWQKPLAVLGAVLAMSLLMWLMPGAQTQRSNIAPAPARLPLPRARARSSHLPVPPPRAYACAGADLDNEGGKDDWGGNIVSRCGNGRRDESETCDDGNLQDGDGCDRHCHLEIPRGCGDVLDRLSWQRWANHTETYLLGKDGTPRWEAPNSPLTFIGQPSSSPGQLADWTNPQTVSCEGAGR